MSFLKNLFKKDNEAASDLTDDLKPAANLSNAFRATKNPIRPIARAIANPKKAAQNVRDFLQENQTPFAPLESALTGKTADRVYEAFKVPEEGPLTRTQKGVRSVQEFFAPTDTMRPRDVVRETVKGIGKIPQTLSDFIGQPMIRSFYALDNAVRNIGRENQSFVPESEFQKMVTGTDEGIDLRSIGKETAGILGQKTADRLDESQAGNFILPAVGALVSASDAMGWGTGSRATLSIARGLSKAKDAGRVRAILRSVEMPQFGKKKMEAIQEALVKAKNQDEVVKIFQDNNIPINLGKKAATSENLLQEAKKHESRKEFKNAILGRHIETVGEPITVYRGEGKGIGNSTLVNGRYFADSQKFAKKFGKVTEHEIPKGTKVFDLDAIKYGDNPIVSDQSLVAPSRLTDFLMDNGIKYTKNTNSRGVEYTELKRPIETITNRREVKLYKNLKKFFGELIEKHETPGSFAKSALKRADALPDSKTNQWAKNQTQKTLSQYYKDVKKGNIPKRKQGEERTLDRIWKRHKDNMKLAESGTPELPPIVRDVGPEASRSGLYRSREVLEGLAKTGDELAIRQLDELETARRGTRKVQETIASANEKMWEVERIANLPKGTAVNADNFEAMRQANRAFKRDLDILQGELMSASEEARPGLERLIEEKRKLLNRSQVVVSAILSEAGRVMNIVQWDSGMERQVDQVARGINKMRQLLVNEGTEKAHQALRNFDKDMARLDMQDPVAVREFYTKFSDASFMQKLAEYYKASLYSAFTTQMFNATASGLMMLFDIPVKVVGGGYDALRSAVKGTPREIYATEALVMSRSLFDNLGMALQEAWRALKTEGYSGTFGKGGDVAARNEGIGRIPAIKGNLGKVIRSPFRLAGAMDLFERTLIQQSNLYTYAYRQARREGKKGLEMVERIEELRNNPPTDILQTAIQKGERFMGYEDLRGIFKIIDSGRKKHPAMQLLIPFYRAIMNYSFVEPWRLTPGRAITDRISEAKGWKRDPFMKNPLTRPEERGRMILGSALSVYALSGMMSGKIQVTGAPPSNQKERTTFYETGKSAYSFRVRKADGTYGKWVNYRKMQPFATLFFVMHQTNTAIDNIKNNRDDYAEGEVGDMMAGLVSETIKFVFTEQAAMQGVSNFLQMLEGGAYNEGVPAAAGRFVRNQLGGFIPNLSFSAARANDPVIYYSDTMRDEIRKRIPGLTDGNVPRRSPLGDVVERTGTPMSRFFNPYQTSREVADPIWTPLEEIGYGIGMPSRKVFDQRLSRKEYDIYLQRSGELIREFLTPVVQNPEFMQMIESSQKATVDKIVSKVRDQARKELFSHYLTQKRYMDAYTKQGMSRRDAVQRSQEQINYSPEGAIIQAQLNYEQAK